MLDSVLSQDFLASLSPYRMSVDSNQKEISENCKKILVPTVNETKNAEQTRALLEIKQSKMNILQTKNLSEEKSETFSSRSER